MGKKNLSTTVEARRKKNKQGNPIKKNPFEVRINRLKHEVVGQKIKTDKGMPGVSRSKANEKVNFVVVTISKSSSVRLHDNSLIIIEHHKYSLYFKLLKSLPI